MSSRPRWYCYQCCSEASTGTQGRRDSSAGRQARRPRRATEATHPLHNSRAGFPALPKLSKIDRLAGSNPEGLSPRPQKASTPWRGSRKRTTDRGIHCWGERRHLRTRPCGPALRRQHPPWGERRHLRTRPCGPALRRLDRRLDPVPRDQHPCRELPRRKRHIARVSTRDRSRPQCCHRGNASSPRR